MWSSGFKSNAEVQDEQEATQVTDGPGGSGQDDPGSEDDVSTQKSDATSHKSTDRTDPSPSCGWRGVAAAMHCKPEGHK